MTARDPAEALQPAPRGAPSLTLQQLRAMFDDNACGLVVQDAHGAIIDGNAAAERLLGLTRDQLMGRSSLDPRWRATDLAGRDLPGCEQPAMRTLRTGEPVRDFEMGVCLPGGVRRWITVNTWLLPEGPVGRVVVSSFVNTTARRNLEETLTDQWQRLQTTLAGTRAHDLLKGLFELSPVGISLVEGDTLRAVDVNRALCQMLGYTQEELIGTDLSQCAPPEQRQERGQCFEQALLEGTCATHETELVRRNGDRISVLKSAVRVLSSEGRPFVWSVAQDITESKAMERALLAAATLDSLTGLPNRNALMRRLQGLSAQARMSEERGFAVLFMDFDRFKLVNDLMGHAAGDELLSMVGERLFASLPQAPEAEPDGGWLAARFGGDEFVLLAPGLCSPADAQAFGVQLLARLGQPYLVRGQTIRSSASIGVAFSEGRSTDADSVLRDADTAMYEAKHAGRGRMVIFDDTMRARLARSVQIEAGLPMAAALGQLNLLYQPIVDLDTGRMSSCEALLRWAHPQLGAVPTGEFIPIAEESGHIIALGEWVLRQSCLQWARWQQQDPQAAPAVVSVNLSRVQLTLGDSLLAMVESALADAAMPAQALQLEITERGVTREATDTRRLMQALRQMGVQLAMDDFGTGASSLGCLRDYPFHSIKIDKSFVVDLCLNPHVLAVAHATVNVIENLGMVSVAEGIEEPDELATLQALGCRYGQGYLFGRPMPADALLAHLAKPPPG